MQLQLCLSSCLRKTAESPQLCNSIPGAYNVHRQGAIVLMGMGLPLNSSGSLDAPQRKASLSRNLRPSSTIIRTSFTGRALQAPDAGGKCSVQ